MDGVVLQFPVKHQRRAVIVFTLHVRELYVHTLTLSYKNSLNLPYKEAQNKTKHQVPKEGEDRCLHIHCHLL